MVDPMVLQEIKNSLFDAFKRDNVIRYFIKRATRTQEGEMLTIESGNNAGEAVVCIYSDSRHEQFNLAIAADNVTFEDAARDAYSQRTIVSWSDMVGYITENQILHWNDVGYINFDEF